MKIGNLKLGDRLRFRGLTRRGKNRLQHSDTFIVRRITATPFEGATGSGPFVLVKNSTDWFWFCVNGDKHVQVMT